LGLNGRHPADGYGGCGEDEAPDDTQVYLLLLPAVLDTAPIVVMPSLQLIGQIVAGATSCILCSHTLPPRPLSPKAAAVVDIVDP
jgi:hypothetical protein